MTTRPTVNKLKAALQGMQAPDTARSPVQLVTAATPAPAKAYAVPASRAGKRVVSAYFQPETVKQLHLLSLERDTTLQALMEEALNDLFRKYGKSAIA